MSVQNVSENSNERYVINSYAVPEETIREGADLVSLCGPSCRFYNGRKRTLGDLARTAKRILGIRSEWMLLNALSSTVPISEFSL